MSCLTGEGNAYHSARTRPVLVRSMVKGDELCVMIVAVAAVKQHAPSQEQTVALEGLKLRDS